MSDTRANLQEFYDHDERTTAIDQAENGFWEPLEDVDLSLLDNGDLYFIEDFDLQTPTAEQKEQDNLCLMHETTLPSTSFNQPIDYNAMLRRIEQVLAENDKVRVENDNLLNDIAIRHQALQNPKVPEKKRKNKVEKVPKKRFDWNDKNLFTNSNYKEKTGKPKRRKTHEYEFVFTVKLTPSL